MNLLKQSTARNISFFMVDSTDSISGKTGLSPTVTISKDAAGFGAPGGSVSEVGNGWYALAANTTDTGTLGDLVIHATAAGADPVDEKYQVCVELPGVVADKTGFSLSAAGVQAIWDALTSALTTVGSIGKLLVTNIDAAISSRLASGSYTAPDNTSIAAVKVVTDKFLFDASSFVKSAAQTVADKTGYALSIAGVQAVWDALTSALTTVGSVGKLLVTNIDTTVSSRLASSSYAAPDNSGIAAIKAKTDNLPAAPADESLVIAATDAIYNRIGAPAGASVSADVAAVKTDSAAIKAKTDNLPASPASTGDVTTAEAAIIAAIPFGYKKNIGVTGFPFRMFDSAGAPATGLTVTVKISKDGSALATSTNSVTELALGWYKLDLTAGEMNAKSIALNFAASGATSYGVALTTES